MEQWIVRIGLETLSVEPHNDYLVTTLITEDGTEKSARSDLPVRTQRADGRSWTIPGLTDLLSRNRRDDRAEDGEQDLLHLVGRHLFELALPDPLGPYLVDGVARLSKKRAHLLLVVALDVPDHDDPATLDDLPWEALNVGRRLQEAPEGYLGLHPNVSMTRGPNGPADPGPPIEFRPLVVDAGGVTMEGKDDVTYPELQSSHRTFEERFGFPEDRATQLLEGESANYDALSSWLKNAVRDDGSRTTILHFSGHGRGDADDRGAGPTRLAFVGVQSGHGTREPWLVGASELRDLAEDHGLDLLVLTCCSAGTGPFRSGLGPRLLTGSVSGVISMQARILDRGATAFSRALYERLTDGAWVHEAVASARRQTYEDGHADWWIPMLHQRAPIEVSPATEPAPASASAAAIPLPPVREPGQWFADGPTRWRGPGVLDAWSSLTARADDGELHIEARERRPGSPRWKPITVDGLQRVVAVHQVRDEARVLAVIGGATVDLHLTPNGERSRATLASFATSSGCRTPGGFWFVDDENRVVGPNPGDLAMTEVRWLDSASSGRTTLVVVSGDGFAWALRYGREGRAASEERSIPTGTIAVPARPGAGALDSIVLVSESGAELVRWEDL